MLRHRLIGCIDTQGVIMLIALVTFSVADAYLTQIALTMGARELNPLAEPFGSNILARELLAVAVAAILLCGRRIKWLLYLNVLVLWVVMWNLWQLVFFEANWLSQG